MELSLAPSPQTEQQVRRAHLSSVLCFAWLSTFSMGLLSCRANVWVLIAS